MLYQREGFPDEGEIVLCTVTKINPNSIFVHVDDYDKGGMVHISEISPGRIRNIRDFVVENKIIVCKVLSVNKERGYIDLSLRRVNETLRRNKLEEIKQEQKAEKILELIAIKYKKDVKAFYHEISKPIIEEYGMVYHGFAQIAAGKIKAEDLKIPKEYKKEIEEMIAKRFKVEQIPVGGILKLSTYADDGVEIIKKLLKDIEKLKNAQVRYLGAGAYRINMESDDVKKDEKLLDEKIEEVIAEIKKHDGTGSFTKEAAEE
ncbi:MAG: S1 RNA-binding domain-containing protein [Nanoarchaeota archaeon]